MEIKAFFDNDTFTLTYVVYDKSTRDAVIIDPVLDFDPAGVAVAQTSIDEVVKFVKDEQLKIHYLLETHAHADHLSGSLVLKQKYFPEAKLAIGKNITKVQELFKKIFNFPQDFPTDGSQFDRLFDEGERIQIGSLNFRVLFTPGHTPACASYLFDEKVLFTGDAIFMPDYGTGRCDFPAGDASALYHSITKKIYSLPDETEIYVGHDYLPNGRDLQFKTTVGEQKAKNKQLSAETSEQQFVSFRESRDATLNAPRLLYPSVQVNIAAGRMPPAESNGQTFLKLPLKNNPLSEESKS
jgi:glyoxylase-like metal-dependent hydrolase (beta-lactamase superfamily II)